MFVGVELRCDQSTENDGAESWGLADCVKEHENLPHQFKSGIDSILKEETRNSCNSLANFTEFWILKTRRKVNVLQEVQEENAHNELNINATSSETIGIKFYIIWVINIVPDSLKIS